MGFCFIFFDIIPLSIPQNAFVKCFIKGRPLDFYGTLRVPYLCFRDKSLWSIRANALNPIYQREGFSKTPPFGTHQKALQSPEWLSGRCSNPTSLRFVGIQTLPFNCVPKGHNNPPLRGGRFRVCSVSLLAMTLNTVIASDSVAILYYDSLH